MRLIIDAEPSEAAEALAVLLRDLDSLKRICGDRPGHGWMFSNAASPLTFFLRSTKAGASIAVVGRTAPQDQPA